MKCVLTIAGSDCSGGAGIQADLKTICAHKCYGMSAITALTAQNTTGVYGVSEVSSEFLRQQLRCIFEDIFPHSVKIGMVSSPQLIKVIAEELRRYKPKNIVLDPVMVATSGDKLLKNGAQMALKEELFPLAQLITPNISEAQVLAQMDINGYEDMVTAAKIIKQTTKGGVLIKGGHLKSCADDLLYTGDELYIFKGERIDTKNTHGTGCTLSSAIASRLAMGSSLRDSIALAKEYINKALRDKMDLGKGSGPLNHCQSIE